MLIDFSKMEETLFPNFKGGEKQYAARRFSDGQNSIMRGRLIPGASIGTHTHETSSEMIFILSGTASIVCDGKPETLTAGQCHYCPKGSTHTMKNNGTDELTFFAVVPEQ